MKKNKFLISVVSLLFGISTVLTGCSSRLTNSPASSNASQQSTTINNSSSYGGITKEQYHQLAKLTFKNGTYGYIKVNNDKSTLNPKSWKTNKVIYSNLDKLNRTSSPNTGFLEKRNLANGSLRTRQFIQPTGWHYNHRDGEQLYNRGHLIAYSVSAGIDKSGKYNPNNESGDQNNPKNLFTQTAYSNQQLQTIYERKVRNALKQGKKVIYQATAVFNGNEKMARGVNLQAISTDGSLNFNVYIFNVQPGYKFNFADGRARKDSSAKVKELPAALQSHYDSDRSNNSSRSNYYRHNNRMRSYKYPGKYQNERQANRDTRRFIKRQYQDGKGYAKSKYQEGKKYLTKFKNWVIDDYHQYKSR